MIMDYNDTLTVQSYQLLQRQSLPLEAKVKMSLSRIKQWYNRWQGQVYIAFSGGKDSTVLLHLVRSLYSEVPGVFVDTGLEYPEIKDFIKMIDNIIWLKPAMNFKKVLQHYGYPVISKSVADAIYRIKSPGCSERTKNKALYGDERGNYGRLPKKWRFLLNAPFKISDKCCEVMKMRPVIKYYKQTGRTAFVGTMASDSQKRTYQYMKHGCYVINKSLPKCTPIAFWNTEDIWEYIKSYRLEYCDLYNKGIHNTGCMFCMFGVHFEKNPNRFQLMKESHPKLYDYCMNHLEIGKVLDYIGVSF